MRGRAPARSSNDRNGASRKPLFSLHSVNCRYSTVRVLSDIGFVIQRGEIVNVIGPSGSGESILLRTIVGLLRRTMAIRLDGVRICSRHASA